MKDEAMQSSLAAGEDEPPETSGVSDVDAAIVTALRRDDRRTALSLCARHHARGVGRLCMALVGSQPEADDLVQETLLAAHDGLEGFRADGSVRAWLFSIARRKCARHLERRSRQTAQLCLVHDSTQAAAADDLLMARQRAERARAALEAVRPSEREAVLLRYQAGLSFREVGEALSIDEAAARKRVSRALARLREALESRSER
jgi:RNA polymerase sigma-70 factor (ECF subfamily)